MKILIIKLGAKGDVIRTLPILPALKKKYPEAEITWLTKPESKEILENIPDIKKLLTLLSTVEEKFDILYNFDIEDDATSLASNIEADRKYGFCKKGEYAAAFNLPAEYYLNTLFDDNLKKSNNKTYQQMMFEAAELPYNKEHHPIYLTEKDRNYAEKFVEENNINTEKLIGIHMGAGERWPSKAWSENKIVEFIIKAKTKGYEILLFGGPDEIEKHKKLSEELEKQNIKIFKNNLENSDREFASLVNLCKAVICSDSYALHISLALKIPTIVLFFCTSPNEVEDYGILKKIVSPLLDNFFPEKSDKYSEELVNSISVEGVLNSVDELEQKIFAEEGKVKSFNELKTIISDLKRKKKRVIWTNGCFNLLHEGHVHYLKKARQLGDYLVVGLNSDESVLKLKGREKLIRPEQARAEIISSLEPVDYVMIFSETSVEKYLKALQPHVYVKAGDYDIKKINQDERKVIENYGGKITFIPIKDDISTTKIIGKIKNGK